MNTRVLGIVLAGGRSARFGSDKALALLGGKTLLERVCERAAPQVDRLLINRSGYAVGSLPVEHALLGDEHPGQGPLAGILAALRYASLHGYSHVVTLPCDTPFFPAGMISRLRGASETAGTDLCIARRGSDEHFVVGLWRTECRPALEQAFAQGVRSIWSAANSVSRQAVDFEIEGEGPGGDAFFNINTVDDLATAESWLKGRPCEPKD